MLLSGDALTIVILAAMLLGVVTSSLTICPTQCACHDVTVSCRFRSLTSVADIFDRLPPEVEQLDLSNNPAISHLNRTSFPLLARMRILRMDECRLRRVESRTFENLRMSLELLDLSRNVIETVDRGAFDGLRSLRRLRLDGNQLTGARLPDSAFRGLSQLALRLDSNRLETLSSSVFVDAEVVSLNLDDNELSSVDALTLRPLQGTLTSLSVTGNRQRTMYVVANAFHNFMFRRLSLSSSGLRSLAFLEDVASVEVLDVSSNPLGKVQLSWSSGLALNCREATLSHINLTTVADAQLSSFRSAQRLDLSRNQLSGTLDVNAFRSVPDLHHLDLSLNAISRLPRDLGIALAQLETLNLSGNVLGQLDRHVFSGADRLSVLDVSYNHIQVLGDDLMTLFSSLSFVGVAGNPLHCNCELRAFWRWFMDNAGNVLHAANTSCASPPTMLGPLAVHDLTDLVCSRPQLLRVTRNLVVNETTNVMLSCLAGADPAPEVIWRSPTNDRISISPPSDRKFNKTSAFWELKHIGPAQLGWYSCNATNIVGSQTGYTYVHVQRPGDPLVDLSALVYPMIPGTSVAVTSHPVTSPSFHSSRSTSTDKSTASSPSTRSYVTSTTEAAVSWTHAQWAEYSGSTFGDSLASNLTTSSLPRPTWYVDSAWKVVLVIVASVLSLLVLVLLVFIVVVCCVRLSRKRQRRLQRCKVVPPAPMPVREDRIRRPMVPFTPGVSIASQVDRGPLPPLPAAVSPTYRHGERLDLLFATDYSDRNYDQLHTFERSNARGGGETNGSRQLLS